MGQVRGKREERNGAGEEITDKNLLNMAVKISRPFQVNLGTSFACKKFL